MIRSIPSTCSLLLLVACTQGDDTAPADDTGDTEPVTFAVWGCADHPCEALSEYGFFDGAVTDRIPADGVLEWEPVSKLWSDHTAKERYVVLPEGEPVGFVDAPDASGDEDWDFPEGTAVIKTFLFQDDFGEPTSAQTVIETRLLVRRSGDWDANVFLWRDDQSEADLYNYGARVPVTFTDEADDVFTFEYVVPNSSMCERCHGRADTNHLLGVFTAQGNHDVDRGSGAVNQIDWLESLGVFDGAVPDPSTLPALVDPFGADDLDLRARSYLHANCSHCHRSGGGADGSGLVLLAWETDPLANGVCKEPPAAGAGTCGLDYDIVPGDPDNSIMVCRMSSTEPEVRMPELPNVLTHPAGIALISEWITNMSGTCPD